MSEPNGERDDRIEAPAQTQCRMDLLDDLIANFEAIHGPVPNELVKEAMREWPDYEER
jgi:hypothetical protein